MRQKLVVYRKAGIKVVSIFPKHLSPIKDFEKYLIQSIKKVIKK